MVLSTIVTLTSGHISRLYYCISRFPSLILPNCGLRVSVGVLFRREKYRLYIAVFTWGTQSRISIIPVQLLKGDAVLSSPPSSTSNINVGRQLVSLHLCVTFGSIAYEPYINCSDDDPAEKTPPTSSPTVKRKISRNPPYPSSVARRNFPPGLVFPACGKSPPKIERRISDR